MVKMRKAFAVFVIFLMLPSVLALEEGFRKATWLEMFFYRFTRSFAVYFRENCEQATMESECKSDNYEYTWGYCIPAGEPEDMCVGLSQSDCYNKCIQLYGEAPECTIEDELRCVPNYPTRIEVCKNGKWELYVYQCEEGYHCVKESTYSVSCEPDAVTTTTVPTTGLCDDDSDLGHSYCTGGSNNREYKVCMYPPKDNWEYRYCDSGFECWQYSTHYTACQQVATTTEPTTTTQPTIKTCSEMGLQECSPSEEGQGKCIGGTLHICTEYAGGYYCWADYGQPCEGPYVVLTCDDVKALHPEWGIIGSCTESQVGTTTCVGNHIAYCGWYDVNQPEPYCWRSQVECIHGCYLDENNIPQCMSAPGVEEPAAGSTIPKPSVQCQPPKCYNPYDGKCYDNGALIQDRCEDLNERWYCINGVITVKYDCEVECKQYRTQSECEKRGCVWFDPYWWEMPKVHEGFGSCMNCIPIGTKVAEGSLNCHAFDGTKCCPFVEYDPVLKVYVSKTRLVEVYTELPRMPGTQRVDSVCYCAGEEVGVVEGQTVYEGIPPELVERIEMGEQKTEGNLYNIIEAGLGGVGKGLFAGLEKFAQVYCIPGTDICFSLLVWIGIVIIGLFVLSFIRR